MRITPVYILALSLAILVGTLSYAGLPTSTDAWDTTYENDPDITDPRSEGPANMRVAKTITRLRAQTEHYWGSGLDSASTTDDNGRHRPGSALTFVQDSPPDIDNDSAADLCLEVEDTDGNRNCEAGRLWLDLDGIDDTDETFDDFTLYSLIDGDGDGFGGTWVEVSKQAPLSTTIRNEGSDQSVASSTLTDINGLSSIALPTLSTGVANYGDRTYDIKASVSISADVGDSICDLRLYGGSTGDSGDTLVWAERYSTETARDNTLKLHHPAYTPASDSDDEVGLAVTCTLGSIIIEEDDSAMLQSFLRIEEVPPSGDYTDDTQS